MTDNIGDSEKAFYYNSGFRDGYHKAMDKVREFVFESYTAPEWCMKSEDSESDDYNE